MNVWQRCFIVRQIVFFFFCNRVSMQVSNVSNLVLWACIKRREVASRTCFGHTKMLSDKDNKSEHESTYCDDGDTTAVTQQATRERERLTNMNKYIREVFGIIVLDERDASVNRVIVLYDWKLIIYSLVPTRLHLCLPCLCCHEMTTNTIRHFNSFLRAQTSTKDLPTLSGELLSKTRKLSCITMLRNPFKKLSPPKWNHLISKGIHLLWF